MRVCSLVVIAVMLNLSCQNNSESVLRAQIDSLRAQQATAYKPGLGEFMSGIQVHHAKLWFAGKAQNWALANFEIKEIKEALDDIPLYCADRPEIKKLPMLEPVVDSLSSNIARHDAAGFEKQFTALTITCNNCHQVTDHGFNKIKIPDTVPYNNQDFSNGK
jgi:hypothetical protein